MASLLSANRALNGLVSNPRGGRVPDGRFRRYASSVVTTSTIRGVMDSRATSIVYEVGRHYQDAEHALARPVANAPRGISAAYPTSSVLAEDFLGYARKYSNFSATFEYTSLAGVAERLARALACLSIHEDVDSDQIAGGARVHISVLGTHSGPVNSLRSSVFIPRLVSTVVSPDTFSVLAAAIAGEGGSIVTDVLSLDAEGVPIVPTCGEDGVSLACVEALRVVGANMVASGQGPLFALAVTRGVHRVLSLISHSDEGGITRDLLRTSSFAAPFGGIHFGLTEYAGLPALASATISCVAAYVDSIAIATAAAVAHCDPGQTFRGEWFPCVLDGTASTAESVEPGVNQAGTAEMAGRNLGLYRAALPDFLRHYCRALGEIFGAPGETSVAETFALASANYIRRDCRHLQYPTIAPFFWVEPTGILSPTAFSTPAEREGSASLCPRDGTKTHSAFRGIWQQGSSGMTHGAYVLSAKGARFMPFLYHWLGHPMNGIGAVRVRQLDPELVVLPGSSEDKPTVRERVLASSDLGSMLWRRGQSPFPAPAEFLNLAGTIGVLVKHASMDDMGVPTLEHVPGAYEICSSVVTVHVSHLQGLAPGTSNAGVPGAARARTRAAAELGAVRARSALFGTPDVMAMPVSLSAPRPGAPLGPEDFSSGGAVPGHRRAHNLPAGTGGGELDVEPVTPHFHMDSNGAPKPNPRAPAIAGIPGGGVGGPARGGGDHDRAPGTPPLADPNPAAVAGPGAPPADPNPIDPAPVEPAPGAPQPRQGAGAAN